jgi:hypothetical protein
MWILLVSLFRFSQGLAPTCARMWSMRGPLLASLLIFQFLTLFPLRVPAPKDEGGLINGTVTYGDGEPVNGATVYAVPLGKALVAILPHANSDESGHFSIRIARSWFGDFAVAAKKEDEDYPDMSQQFYSDGKFRTVTLSANHPSRDVVIQLGPKGGVLVGTVADAFTSAPLSPCVEFRRALEPNNFLSGSGLVKPSYKLLVPADTDVLVAIYLDGYKTWYFPNTVVLTKGSRSI